GTPQYLSPEQALGKAVDHRSDLYATGCLLYELLALRPPFTGETPLSVVYQHVQDPPVPPSDVTQSVPPELDGLVMRSLAKDPDDRFQSAEEMRGLIQYGLQMLQQQGGHTGTWNTGPVEAHEGGHTPVGGVAATTAMGHPMHGDTSQGPILPPMNPEDGGYGGYDGGTGGNGGYGSDGYGSHGGGNGRRGKVWLFAALALIAVVAGVVYALDKAGSPGGTTGGTTPTVSNSPSTKSEEPSPSPSTESEQPSTDPGTSDGGVTQDPWPPPTTYRPTTQPPTTAPPTTAPSTTTEPPTEPTDEPTEPTDPPTNPTDPPETGTPTDPTGGNNSDPPPTDGAESG
ncbi:serine/threonine protein kinase, partial [Streptomyces sp. SID6041]|nr:serine/threonine protein kinase [Streptomyces sp. SID6041]